MLRALGRDPLVIKQTRVDSVYGLVDLMDAALAAAPRVDDRALVLYGERDELVPAEAVQRLLARLPVDSRDRRRVALYSDGYHMLLRDLQAEAVWNDVAAVDRGLPPTVAVGGGFVLRDGRRLPGPECLRYRACARHP